MGKVRSKSKGKAHCSQIVGFVLLGGVIAPTAFASVTSGQNYKIVSACSTTGQVMAVSGDSLANNAAIVLAARNDSKTSQIFKIETYGSGYKITAQNSGKTLNIANASKASKAALEQYKFTGVSSEIFTIESTSDGYYRFKSVNSGLYINLVNASTANGTPFEQYLNTTACAEKFSLVAFATPSPSPSPSPKPSPSPSPSPTPAPSPSPTVGARDPLKQPFASNSIWNMPIGKNAVYVASNIYQNSNPSNNIWAPFPGADEDRIFLTPTAPLTPVYFSSAAWSGANRCSATGDVKATVPMPSSYVVPSDNQNESAVFLMPDHRSLVHLQPLSRCTSGGHATAFAFWNSVDLYGDGIAGSHGGSGLSAIGGTIRMGELRPGQQGPRHALKVAVYGKSVFYNCKIQSDCYRWPAKNADSYAVGFYGSNNGNTNKAMRMGALLAIPPSVDISTLGLETEPGHQIAWTMQNYGAYIDDDMYGSPGILFDTEYGPAGRKLDEFQKDYGYTFLQKVNAPNAWLRDIQRIMKVLSVVDNNGPTSIGGGGIPLQPLAPAIAP